jgi:hypothetical protein
MFKKINYAGTSLAILPLACAMAASAATPEPLFLTATNGISNYLAVINTKTKEMDFVPTGGAGGASGNAGGVAVEGKLAAVVNYGSSNVTIFLRQGNTMQPTQVIKTSSQPVSAAFGHGHLVVLGVTTAESFTVYGTTVAQTNDGISQLQIGDKSAAQIVTYAGGVAYSEKTGGIAELALSTDGMSGISGPGKPVLLPSAPNNNTPFGMVGRGSNLYVTIAHSNLEALVVNGLIVSLAAGPTPFTQGASIIHAPCWNALSGQFLYSSDSPGSQLYRYLVSDTNIYFDKAGVAKLSGQPTDLAVLNSLLGVIDGGDGVNSNVSLFDIDSEGELTLRFALKIPSPINGAAIVD